MAHWQDRTSYSQSEAREVRVPRAWGIGKHPHEVKVHRLHGVPDAWFLTCYALGIDTLELGADALDSAQSEALAVVRQALDRFTAAFVDVLAASATGTAEEPARPTTP